jgi:hypothetical protein
MIMIHYSNYFLRKSHRYFDSLQVFILNYLKFVNFFVNDLIIIFLLFNIDALVNTHLQVILTFFQQYSHIIEIHHLSFSFVNCHI